MAVADEQEMRADHVRGGARALGASVHFILDWHLVTTVPSRLRPEDLAYLTMRSGAGPAGPEPAPPALPRARSGTAILAAGEPVQVDRKVHRDGIVCLSGGRYQVGFALAGRTITLRLDGHLMHAITDNALMGTWPCPAGRPPGADRRGTDGDVPAAASAPACCCYPGPAQGA
ncbi:hypothetical protein ACWC9U_21355 [Streptomyces sp. 900116325]